MSQIRVGVPTLVIKNNKILLGESNKKFIAGQYVIPGGGVDFGEKLAETSAREIFEETSLKIKNIKVFKPYELIKPDNHRIMILHTAEWESGEIIVGDDLASANFFSREQITELFNSGKIEANGPVAKMLRDTGWLD